MQQCNISALAVLCSCLSTLVLSQCINHPIHTVPDHEFATRCCAGILTSAAAAAAAAAAAVVAVAVAAAVPTVAGILGQPHKSGLCVTQVVEPSLPVAARSLMPIMRAGKSAPAKLTTCKPLCTYNSNPNHELLFLISKHLFYFRNVIPTLEM